MRQPSHKPRKRFGQNFLKKQEVIDDILHAIGPQPDDLMVEIGPGLGAVTNLNDGYPFGIWVVVDVVIL